MRLAKRNILKMAFSLIGIDLRDINTNKNNTIIYGKRQKELIKTVMEKSKQEGKPIDWASIVLC